MMISEQTAKRIGVMSERTKAMMQRLVREEQLRANRRFYLQAAFGGGKNQ